MKLRKILPLSFLLALCGCESDQSDKFNDWNGTEEDFSNTFQFSQPVSKSDEMLLIDKQTRLPFSGKIKRIQIEQTTEQFYEDGLLNGKSIKKSESGATVEANYLDGRLHGKLMILDSEGQVRSMMKYEDGKLVVPK